MPLATTSVPHPLHSKIRCDLIQQIPEHKHEAQNVITNDILPTEKWIYKTFFDKSTIIFKFIYPKIENVKLKK